MEVNFDQDEELFDGGMGESMSSTDSFDDSFNDVSDDTSINFDDSSDLESDPVSDNLDEDDLDKYDYNLNKKKQNLIKGGIIGAVALALVSLGLIAILFTKQNSSDNAMKKWVVAYLSEKLGEGMSDEELMALANQLEPQLQGLGLVGEDGTVDFSNLTQTEIDRLVEQLRGPLLSNMSEEEASQFAESIIKEYLQEVTGIEGLTQYDLASVLDRLDELQQNDATLAKEIKNSTGAKGEKGDKGDKGDTGQTGQKGQQGNTGATGQTGQTGQKGATGSQGQQGARGEKGETGAAGKDGKDGKDGINGEDGEDGLSAYEIAVKNGDIPRTMSESDWLKSLKGSEGQSAQTGYLHKSGTQTYANDDPTDSYAYFIYVPESAGQQPDAYYQGHSSEISAIPMTSGEEKLAKISYTQGTNTLQIAGSQ